MSDCEAGKTSEICFCVSDEGVKVRIINENGYSLMIHCPDKERKKNSKSSSGKRCDLMCTKLCNPSMNYYVEIKTTLTKCNEEKAVDQLIETIKVYQDLYPSDYNVYIACRRDRNPKADAWRLKMRKRFSDRTNPKNKKYDIILSKPCEPAEIKIG